MNVSFQRRARTSGRQRTGASFRSPRRRSGSARGWRAAASLLRGFRSRFRDRARSRTLPPCGQRDRSQKCSFVPSVSSIRFNRIAPGSARTHFEPSNCKTGIRGELDQAALRSRIAPAISGGVHPAGLRILPSARRIALPPWPSLAIFDRWTSANTASRSMPYSSAVP